jgi:glycosyltransferase involved in cell wall biosynthesis
MGALNHQTVAWHLANRGITVSVVICIRNEEKAIRQVLSGIPSYIREILIVDGHSTDNSAREVSDSRPGTLFLLQPGNGKGDAIKYGILNAKGDIIVTMDGDGNTDPVDLPKMIMPLLDGYDIVKGSRFRGSLPKGMPKHRIFGNIVLAVFASIMFGYWFSDICSGYVGMKAATVKKLGILDHFGSKDVESVIYMRAAKSGLRMREVSTPDPGRIGGISKMPSFREGWNNIKIILRERF